MSDLDLELDPSTGNADLAWLLVVVFFLTTVLAVRPELDGIAPDAEGAGRAITVALEQGDAHALTVSSSGGRPGPGVTNPQHWLAEICAQESATVEVRCPSDAAHGWCRTRLADLARATPGCRYRY